jgi:hypothetical protein
MSNVGYQFRTLKDWHEAATPSLIYADIFCFSYYNNFMKEIVAAGVSESPKEDGPLNGVSHGGDMPHISAFQAPVVSSSVPAQDGSDEAVFHRLVLLLGKRDAKLPPVPWEDLLTLLTPKHHCLSKTQLQCIVNSHKSIFLSATNAGVLLFPFSHDHVIEYFDLSESVAKTGTASEAKYSLSQPCSVKISKTIVVSGIVFKAETTGGGNVLLFQFGNGVLYRLQNIEKDRSYMHGQMFNSVLRLR